MSQTVSYEYIEEAIHEAMILESAHDRYDESNMLKIAQKLSGESMASVQEVFMRKRGFTKLFTKTNNDL